MVAFTTVVIVGFASALMVSSLAKLFQPAALIETLRALGFPARIARHAMPPLVVAEWLLAVGLVIAPSSLYARALVIALLGCFAVAGLYALVLRQKIACACLGRLYSGKLGLHQVLIFSVATILLLVPKYSELTWGLQTRLLVVFVLGVVAAIVFLAFAVRDWLIVRDQRESLHLGFSSPAGTTGGTKVWE